MNLQVFQVENLNADQVKGVLRCRGPEWSRYQYNDLLLPVDFTELYSPQPRERQSGKVVCDAYAVTKP